MTMFGHGGGDVVGGSGDHSVYSRAGMGPARGDGDASNGMVVPIGHHHVGGTRYTGPLPRGPRWRSFGGHTVSSATNNTRPLPCTPPSPLPIGSFANFSL